ncbi:putative ribonuclease T(2) [Rosa chinensis]|uniref:Putative ribonuclease T(2) n=1 Tax=Rosa chinensis TaxID=74649 RepID=A0A2P6R7V1_ROSCH|nr:ribonuclease S-7 [Rosa chinensis]PRQ42515.1 putative ribonuclease T(2) [Rosa chinensis]
MKTPAAVCLIFLLSVILLKGSHAEPYEYLQFVLQYSKGYCYNTQICFARLPKMFTIHGVWPANISNPLVRCKQSKKLHQFKQNVMTTSLQNDLGQSWPNVERAKTNIGFWKEEYEKHGSCTAPAITQKAYFERAHELWKEYDLYTILDKKQIKPGHSYALTDFEAAVKSKIGTDTIPLILCKEDTLTTGSSTTGLILREIVICFDHQGTNLVNCTRPTDCKRQKSTTKDNMIYYVP